MYERITFLHILQEVRGIGKTRNQLNWGPWQPAGVKAAHKPWVATHRQVMLHHDKGSRRRRGFPTQADGLWRVHATPIIDYTTVV